MTLDDGLRSQYAYAADLMAELDRLRRVWMSRHPGPPLTRGGIFTLGTLDKLEQCGEGPVTPSRLAAALKQSPPVVSQRLRALEEAGYIQRTAAHSDRRVAHLKLTAKGRKETRQALGTMMGAMERALADLPDGGAQEMLNLLRQLNASLEADFAGQTTDKGGDTPC